MLVGLISNVCVYIIIYVYLVYDRSVLIYTVSQKIMAQSFTEY